RREPSGDAARRGRAPPGGRSPDPDDSSSAAAGTAPPGPRLPLPGLRASAGRGASRAPLGAGRPDHALEPRAALSPPPPRGPRGGLPDRATARLRRPDGRLLPEVPPPGAVPADPVQTL